MICSIARHGYQRYSCMRCLISWFSSIGARQPVIPGMMWLVQSIISWRFAKPPALTSVGGARPFRPHCLAFGALHLGGQGCKVTKPAHMVWRTLSLLWLGRWCKRAGCFFSTSRLKGVINEHKGRLRVLATRGLHLIIRRSPHCAEGHACASKVLVESTIGILRAHTIAHVHVVGV